MPNSVAVALTWESWPRGGIDRGQGVLKRECSRSVKQRQVLLQHHTIRDTFPLQLLPDLPICRNVSPSCEILRDTIADMLDSLL